MPYKNFWWDLSLTPYFVSKVLSNNTAHIPNSFHLPKTYQLHLHCSATRVKNQSQGNLHPFILAVNCKHLPCWAFIHRANSFKVNLGGEQDPRENRRDKTKRRMGEYRFKGKGQENRKVKNLFEGVGGGGRKAKGNTKSKLKRRE